MSKLRCCFCQQELHKDSDGYYTCYTDNCGCMKYGGNGASGSKSLWLALMHTHKALEKATKCINWVIDTFQKGLEHESDVVGCCELSLWNIEAPEQKDK